MKLSFILFYFLLATLSTSAQRHQVSVSVELPDSTFSITTARFYITNVQFMMTDGSVYNEADSYRLVDIEEDSSLHFSPVGIPVGNIDSISFLIGTDSLVNVSGILDGALDPINGMYWAWNTGYINFKIEGTQLQSSPRSFEYHIGGYAPPFTTARRITLAVSDQQHTNIHVDLVHFLHAATKLSPSVLIPGQTASQCADIFQQCFRSDEK